MYIKVRLVIFLKKSPFGANRQLGENLIYNSATLYLVMICKDFLKRFIMMKHKVCTKLTLLNFNQNILFWDEKAICAKLGLKLCNLISHDPHIST